MLMGQAHFWDYGYWLYPCVSASKLTHTKESPEYPGRFNMSFFNKFVCIRTGSSNMVHYNITLPAVFISHPSQQFCYLYTNNPGIRDFSTTKLYGPIPCVHHDIDIGFAILAVLAALFFGTGWFWGLSLLSGTRVFRRGKLVLRLAAPCTLEGMCPFSER